MSHDHWHGGPDSVHIHLCLLVVRGTHEQPNRMAGVSRFAKSFTPKQGQYVAFIYIYSVCTAGHRPKPTCSNIFASARLRFNRWSGARTSRLYQKATEAPPQHRNAR
jgi:hypothetical protein